MNAAAAALSDERVLLDHRPPAVVGHEIARRYGQGEMAVDALRGVSLEVPRGQLTAVMGPSGSGKSTLMHILAGLDQPTSGTVEIAGIDITALRDNELTKLRRTHIGFVFQFFNLLPMLTAQENVVLPLTIAGRKPLEPWLEQLLESGAVGEGMIPKIRSCIAALRSNVGRVHILDGRVPHALLLEFFTRQGIGTMVEATP